MASTAEPALVDSVLAYTALHAVQIVKETSMPSPANRKRTRRPTRSTRKAHSREMSQHQIVRPPLMAAWDFGLRIRQLLQRVGFGEGILTW